MKYIIYGKDNCQFCTKAQNLLTSRGLKFEYKKLGEDFNREELLEMFPEAKTFPQIQIMTPDGNTTYIGGYTDLVDYI